MFTRTLLCKNTVHSAMQPAAKELHARMVQEAGVFQQVRELCLSWVLT